jgi:hypothetical protein
MKPVKILSIRQPWANYIVWHDKDVENRTWATNYRGPVLIHASKRLAMNSGTTYPRGGIVGIAEIVDCVSAHPSKWFEGPFAFVLERRQALPFVPWVGQQGLFTAPIELLERFDLREYLAR